MRELQSRRERLSDVTRDNVTLVTLVAPSGHQRHFAFTKRHYNAILSYVLVLSKNGFRDLHPKVANLRSVRCSQRVQRAILGLPTPSRIWSTGKTPKKRKKPPFWHFLASIPRLRPTDRYTATVDTPGAVQGQPGQLNAGFSQEATYRATYRAHRATYRATYVVQNRGKTVFWSNKTMTY